MSEFKEPKHVVFVCTGDKCSKRGGKSFYKQAKSLLKMFGKRDEIELVKVDCFDRCKFAPVLTFQPENIWCKEYHEKEMLRKLEELTQHF